MVFRSLCVPGIVKPGSQQQQGKRMFIQLASFANDFGCSYRLNGVFEIVENKFMRDIFGKKA
ncbi:MAG: hypothetical protein IPH12_18115 [Saprospirales bacterium]|nr:hypothetical protein [Saprospirales bacterium]